MKCAGVPITEGTRVCRQLRRKQNKHQTDRARKRSSKYRAKRQTLVKQKFQTYFQRAKNETRAGYLKWSEISNPPLSDSKMETWEHSYNKMKKVKWITILKKDSPENQRALSLLIFGGSGLKCNRLRHSDWWQICEMCISRVDMSYITYVVCLCEACTRVCVWIRNFLLPRFFTK